MPSLIFLLEASVPRYSPLHFATLMSHRLRFKDKTDFKKSQNWFTCETAVDTQLAQQRRDGTEDLERHRQRRDSGVVQGVNLSFASFGMNRTWWVFSAGSQRSAACVIQFNGNALSGKTTSTRVWQHSGRFQCLVIDEVTPQHREDAHHPHLLCPADLPCCDKVTEGNDSDCVRERLHLWWRHSIHLCCALVTTPYGACRTRPWHIARLLQLFGIWMLVTGMRIIPVIVWLGDMRCVLPYAKNTAQTDRCTENTTWPWKWSPIYDAHPCPLPILTTRKTTSPQFLNASATQTKCVAAHENDARVLVSVESIVVDTAPQDQNIDVVLQPKRLSSEHHKKTVL